MSYIQELKDVIKHLHGAEAVHIRSVPVKEIFRNEVVWDGVVEVFDLIGHPTAKMVYAWGHDTDDPERPRRHIKVLHAGPVTSAVAAVRAAIAQEFRNAQEA
jgi:vacuolar-type H+-ATPase subunit I/STV1